MKWSDEDEAIFARILGDAPPLTQSQLSRISAITGLVPVDIDVVPERSLGSTAAFEVEGMHDNRVA
ncbi:Uncharacterised protein [Mycobacteroides abscessus subsp. abscessus]|nr:Uncharacterised protein [Mycobacteroides abscessus subsp. abscessus]